MPPDVPPLEELHHDERHIIFDASIEDAHDVGVSKAGQRPELSLETKKAFLFLRRVRQENFQRNFRPVAWINGLIDDPHTARAETANEAISAYRRALACHHTSLPAQCLRDMGNANRTLDRAGVR